MIYTLTLNPAVDYVVRLDQLQVGALNRVKSDEKFAGGKGINVSRILRRLDVTSMALGCVGGFTGAFIVQQLEDEGIQTNFTQIAGDTRINVKIKAGSETEVNSPGPHINDFEFADLMQTLAAVNANDVVIFAGSAPARIGTEGYLTLIEHAHKQGAQVVCDFEGQTLLQALKFKPLLVKPNKEELAAMYGVQIQSIADVVAYGRRLLLAGAQHVIVSLAGEGAVLLTESGNYFAPPAQGVVRNSVGAGDSMVAGFVGTLIKTGDVQTAFKVGVASGSASAFSEDLASAKSIKMLLESVIVEEI